MEVEKEFEIIKTTKNCPNCNKDGTEEVRFRPFVCLTCHNKGFVEVDHGPECNCYCCVYTHTIGMD